MLASEMTGLQEQKLQFQRRQNQTNRNYATYVLLRLELSTTVLKQDSVPSMKLSSSGSRYLQIAPETQSDFS